MALDRRRLAKIMARTQSDQSGEVFSALVIANRLLRESGETWETVLVGRGHSSVVRGGSATPPSWMRGEPTKTIEEAIEYLLERDQPVKLGAWLEGLRRRIAGKKAGSVLTPREQGTLFELVDEEERRRGGR
jgi:hypothetical protein